jgi:hypothetical protein
MPALGGVEDSIRDDFSLRRADAMLMPCEFATSCFELGTALGLYGR